MIKKERDVRIDILRAIAIISIIIAHSNPTSFIFEIRNFDVVLMVILTGLSYYISCNTKDIDYTKYIIKRFKRLIIPTWIFLTIFFFIFYILSILTKNKFYFDLKTIIYSYTLIDGIGYVWIMRILFIVSLLSPIILSISNKIESNLKYFIFLLMIYIVYHYAVIRISEFNGIIAILIEELILYSMGWGIIASIGIRLYRIDTKELKLYLIIFISIFIGSAIFYNFESIQNYKYPPTIYYMSYGISVSILFNILIKNKYVYNIFDNSFIMYNSFNSIWIYFWHILAIYILDLYKNINVFIGDNFIAKFLFIYIFAIGMTLLQNYIKSSFIYKNIIANKLRIKYMKYNN